MAPWLTAVAKSQACFPTRNSDAASPRRVVDKVGVLGTHRTRAYVKRPALFRAAAPLKAAVVDVQLAAFDNDLPADDQIPLLVLFSP